MGLGGLVVREIVKNREERPLILGTSLALKMSGAIVGYILLMIYAYRSVVWLTDNFLSDSFGFYVYACASLYRDYFVLVQVSGSR